MYQDEEPSAEELVPLLQSDLKAAQDAVDNLTNALRALLDSYTALREGYFLPYVQNTPEARAIELLSVNKK